MGHRPEFFAKAWEALLAQVPENLSDETVCFTKRVFYEGAACLSAIIESLSKHARGPLMFAVLMEETNEEINDFLKSSKENFQGLLEGVQKDRVRIEGLKAVDSALKGGGQ